jgi:hypothetical protein
MAAATSSAGHRRARRAGGVHGTGRCWANLGGQGPRSGALPLRDEDGRAADRRRRAVRRQRPGLRPARNGGIYLAPKT